MVDMDKTASCYSALYFSLSLASTFGICSLFFSLSHASTFGLYSLLYVFLPLLPFFVSLSHFLPPPLWFTELALSLTCSLFLSLTGRPSVSTHSCTVFFVSLSRSPLLLFTELALSLTCSLFLSLSLRYEYLYHVCFSVFGVEYDRFFSIVQVGSHCIVLAW
jgi:hypothetical protein